MKKNLLVAALLSTVTALTFAQAPDSVVASAEAASAPMHMKAKHRKPMHVESTQPKAKSHHAKKAAAPAPQASAAQ